MATISPTFNIQLDSLVTVTWANMTSADTADAHFVRGRPQLVALQAEGTWNSTTVCMQGSISGVAYANATDMTQTEIALTSNSGFSVLEPYIYWKPAVTGGSSDNVQVSLSYWIR